MSDPVGVSRPILERFRLDGRVCLVTGAGQGIGRALAHALGQAGAAVAVVDKNKDTAEAVAAELSSRGVDAMAVTADVTRVPDIAAMVERVLARWGRLQVAVNNAGVGMWVSSETADEESWRSVMKVNFDAVFFCAQAEGRHMLAAGYGKIVNIASMSAHIANTPQNQAAYNASKAGVLHLTRTLAAEWASRGVRVNSLSPGYTRTALVDNLLQTRVGQGMVPEWLRRIPMGRMAEVTDLQGAAVFLAAEVSDYMTGADLLIDGGYCCW